MKLVYSTNEQHPKLNLTDCVHDNSKEHFRLLRLLPVRIQEITWDKLITEEDGFFLLNQHTTYMVRGLIKTKVYVEKHPKGMWIVVYCKRCRNAEIVQQ